VLEAREVADLGDQPERGQRLDPAERSEPLDLPRPALIAGDLLQARVQRGELTVDPVQMDQHLFKRRVRERIGEPLLGDPRAVRERPGLLALANTRP
jgi:hypothetical protein